MKRSLRPVEDLHKLYIEIALSGDYLQEVKFINGLERDKMFFLIDGDYVGRATGERSSAIEAGNLSARGSAEVVKLGTENKKKTIIAGVLVVVAAVLLAHTFMGGGEDSAAAPAPATSAPHGAAQTVHKTPHALLAHSLDPSLRFDLLKSSEDVTYKGTGRNIFTNVAPPPEIPKPENPDLQPTACLYATASAAHRSEVLRICRTQGRQQAHLSIKGRRHLPGQGRRHCRPALQDHAHQSEFGGSTGRADQQYADPSAQRGIRHSGSSPEVR